MADLNLLIVGWLGTPYVAFREQSPSFEAHHSVALRRQSPSQAKFASPDLA
jgi:hypothetical protein